MPRDDARAAARRSISPGCARFARMGVEIDIITGRPLLQPALYTVDDIPTTVLRSPYMRDLVYKVQGKRVIGRLGSMALHVDEEWFSRLAWARIAARPVKPDLVLSHAVHQAARLRTLDVPVAIYLPGPPHPRYKADLQQADALISDGWAAKHLPAVIGAPVDDVLKGVDIGAVQPGWTGLSRGPGPRRQARRPVRDAPCPDQEPRAARRWVCRRAS